MTPCVHKSTSKSRERRRMNDSSPFSVALSRFLPWPDTCLIRIGFPRLLSDQLPQFFRADAFSRMHMDLTRWSIHVWLDRSNYVTASVPMGDRKITEALHNSCITVFFPPPFRPYSPFFFILPILYSILYIYK